MFKILRDGPYFFKEMSLKPHEWPFKLQKWDFRAFKPRSFRGWGLEGSKLKGIGTSENQGKALRQDFALFIECKNRVLINNIQGDDCWSGNACNFTNDSLCVKPVI